FEGGPKIVETHCARCALKVVGQAFLRPSSLTRAERTDSRRQARFRIGGARYPSRTRPQHPHRPNRGQLLIRENGDSEIASGCLVGRCSPATRARRCCRLTAVLTARRITH